MYVSVRMNDDSILIMGAGPAGLSAAYELFRQGRRSILLDADSQVGGLSKTLSYKGFLFDIGGHRFFTKVSLVEDMWWEVLGDDFLTCPRLSRIYYSQAFFNYPLKLPNVIAGLGLLETARCALSYFHSRIRPIFPELDFETWVSNRFGRRLFEIFFRTYTEKVWGMKCTEISADWAAQRIQSLSLGAILKNMLSLPGKKPGPVAKTLIETFHYPRLGPGLMWERTAQIIQSAGSQVLLETPVDQIFHENSRITSVSAGTRVFKASNYISSIPLRTLVERMSPAVPAHVLQASQQLRYRDYLAVCLICNGTKLFPDNWIYIHEPSVHVGRIQNYGNWSAAMVPDPSKSCLGLEYFCFEGDDLWNMPDSELLGLAAKEVSQLGLVKEADIEDGTVLRVSKAYPVYDATYQQAVAVIRDYIGSIQNLQVVGRNGMHRYNNQDHSMLTGILAARNVLGAKYDLWKVNADQEYHEAGEGLTDEDIRRFNSSQPLVPKKLSNKS